MAYKFSLKAKKDLMSLVNYTTEQFGIVQSDDYLAQLKNTLENIALFPRMGRKRTEISDDIFSFVYQSHTIFYQVRTDYIFIVRILHNRMDHRRYM